LIELLPNIACALKPGTSRFGLLPLPIENPQLCIANGQPIDQFKGLGIGLAEFFAQLSAFLKELECLLEFPLGLEDIAEL